MCTCVTVWLCPFCCLSSKPRHILLFHFFGRGSVFVCAYARACVFICTNVRMCLPERLCIFRDHSSLLLCYTIISDFRCKLAIVFLGMSVVMCLYVKGLLVRLSFRPLVGPLFFSNSRNCLFSTPELEGRGGGRTNTLADRRDKGHWLTHTRANSLTHTCVQTDTKINGRNDRDCGAAMTGIAKGTHAWTHNTRRHTHARPHSRAPTHTDARGSHFMSSVNKLVTD